MKEKLKLFSPKSIVIVLIFIILGVAFLLFGTSEGENTQQNDNGILLASEYKMELERTASYMCASLSGVETASVNITLSGGMTYVYAKNSEGSYGGTYFQSGGDPLFLKYNYPEIIGCAVVCSGAVNSELKLELTQMMSAYLGIPTNKIYIGYK